MSWVRTVTKTMKLVTYPEIGVGSGATVIANSQVEENHGSVAGIILSADPANTAIVYIGDATVTTNNGIPLQPGEKISLSVFDPYDIWAVTAGDICILRIAKI